jgi:hypothetical protein
MTDSMLKKDGIIICTAIPDIAVIIRLLSTYSFFFFFFFVVLNFQNKAGNEASEIRNQKYYITATDSIMDLRSLKIWKKKICLIGKGSKLLYD